MGPSDRAVAAIWQASSPADLAMIRELVQESWTALGFTPAFQNFQNELAELPGKFAPPRGRLLLAMLNDEPAGCVALRPFDETRSEMKRMYVRPQFRGQGIGEALV